MHRALFVADPCRENTRRVRWSVLVLVGLILLPFARTRATGPCGANGVFTSPGTCTYSPTNAEDTFAVPDGVFSIHVVVSGAAAGGSGARVTADVPVSSSSTLYVEVGGNAVGASGGFNGGGSGASGIYAGGAGGGGASDIRTSSNTTGSSSLTSRLVVAGGGGGDGAGGFMGCNAGGRGGAAGATGSTGSDCYSSGDIGGTGGGGATALAGGTGGTTGGGTGSFGVGGTGGSAGPSGGGGGGGGYYGGGGGGASIGTWAAGGGGGGGSSYAATGASNLSFDFNPTGVGSVTITWIGVGTVDQTIAFADLPDRLLASSPFSVSATATSGLPVIFQSLTPGVCSVSATSVSLSTTGTCTIRADQPGDSTYKAAPGISHSFLVVKHFFTVNTTADAVDGNPGDGVCETVPGSGACSLRAAVQEANASAGLDELVLPAGTYGLTIAGSGIGAEQGDLDVTDPLVIIGAGARTTVIQGDSGATFDDRIFRVSAATAIAGVTIRNGYLASGNGYGGGIFVDQGIALTLESDTVSTNYAVNRGGGIYNQGLLTVRNSTLSGNSAGEWGGGIFNSNGSIYWTNAGTLDLANVTIAGNYAVVGGGIGGWANGVMNNVTITRNAAASHAGGARLQTELYSYQTLQLSNTILAGNAAGDCYINYSTGYLPDITSLGHNLGPSECGLSTTTNDQVTATPMTLPLADNGGPTQTAALATGSPAIDNGNPSAPGGSATACAATDQRGSPRVGTCDIGAYEYGVVSAEATVTTQIHDAAHTTVTSVSFGAEVHDSVTVSGAGTTPTGTVTLAWFANSSCSGSPTATSSTMALASGAVDATGFAQAPSAVGSYSFQASYSGDSNYDPATGSCEALTVAQGTQTTVMVTGPASVTFGTTGTATASGGNGTGAYSFSAGASTGCSITGTTVSVSNASGTCALTATRAGDSNYAASAPSAAYPVTLNKADQTITFGPIANTKLNQPPFTVSATASSGLAVTFTSLTQAVCTSGGANGATITLLATGTCTVSSHQGGNNNYNAAPDVNQSFIVGNGKQDQTITFGPLADRTMLQSPFTVSATASSGAAVTITTTTPAVCTTGGMKGATITLVAPGTCTLQASQAGNASYNPAPTVTQSFGVTMVDQTITFGPLPNRRLAQSPITVSATASSGLTVAFTTTTPAVCTATGKNGATIRFAATGTCTVQASQTGNAAYNPAPSVTQGFLVTP